MKRAVILCLAALSLVGCATVGFRVRPRTPLNPIGLSDQRVFALHVTYFNQDNNGLTQSIDDIEARVLVARTEDLNYYKWLDYRIRSYLVGPAVEDRMENLSDSTVPWKDYAPAIGFDYTVKALIADENGTLSNLPNMDSVPRDMDGFRFYTNIIDFHTWDVYRDMFLVSHDGMPASILKVGDASLVPMPSNPIPLLDWKGVSSDFRFEGGYARAEYLADVNVNGVPLKLLWIEQNQRMKQNVYGMAGFVQLKMPYQGTTRFFAHLYFDMENRFHKANLNEYVYSKVDAPVAGAVIVHTKRAYSIRLEE